jgi:hypothetical protein
MKSTLIPIAAALATCAWADAASIQFSGFVEGNEVTDWRTTTTPKSMDGDGDNLYGTFASVQWKVSGLNEHAAGSDLPGWNYVSGGAQYMTGAPIDNNTGGADVSASIILNQFTFEMTGTAETYANRVVRVGVMADMLASHEWAADQNKGYQLIQIVGGDGDSGVITLRGGAQADGVPEMYFFDLYGVKPGDRFQLLGHNNANGEGATQSAYMGPVTWDIIPEPSIAMLAGLGLLVLLTRRKNP